ncbi:hypothetical protein MMC14_009382 [Varicellaria rhodocarpa]|nr:hypothetical protein [Varicellaria rhodocarpa]
MASPSTSASASDSEHNGLHWRFCYSDYCLVHYGAKMDEGYFPVKPRNKPRKVNHAREKAKYEARCLITWGAENDTKEPTKPGSDWFSEDCSEIKPVEAPKVSANNCSNDDFDQYGWPREKVDPWAKAAEEPKQPSNNDPDESGWTTVTNTETKKKQTAAPKQSSNASKWTKVDGGQGRKGW